MDKQTAAEESAKYLIGKIIVVVVFALLMASFIVYFDKSSPDIKRQTLQAMASQFSTSVTNAHWQWQAEGRPQIVILIHYEARMTDSKELVETDRRPIQMNHLGWPKADASGEGCARLWEMVLNIPLDIDGFRVFAEYFAGAQDSDTKVSGKCRYRLSLGPYFEYDIATGQVSQVQD